MSAQIQKLTASELNSAPLLERTVAGLHETLIHRLHSTSKTDAVLDIGCGTGAWLDRLARHGFTNLHGIDLDISQFATTVATCSQANLDYDELGLSSRKYKFVTAIELIEHLENPGRLFHHVSRLLDVDGRLLLTTPNIESVVCRFRFLLTGKLKQFDDKGDPTHIYPVLGICLERVLERYGLAIEQRWCYPENGDSISSRPITRLGARLLKPFFPESLGGDVACFMIRRVG